MKKVIMKGHEINLLGKTLNVGDIAPDFTVLDQNLNEVKLSDYKGIPVIVSTFPSIDTGVCAIQATKFNNEISKFSNKAKLILVSNDLPFALHRYCGANGIDNAIVTSAHRDEVFARDYGVLLDQIRLLARTVFIIDKSGKLVYKEIVENVSNEPDYNKALSVLNEII
ncbi:thiol peroxidase [Oceanivirga miroungae]|uniref:Redoxin n=1 Tax=Oceanivirga miroungae TaxID=1130046 RepID=A0A6I8MCQ0_9FUSO|nr:thiol peroxidase [Oceanivirga miroungae]VWL85262.1 redoxin [Oceanivirga miroungae]